MIELERREATRFRTAVRHCVAGRLRGLSPPVTLQRNEDGLTLSVVLQEAALALHLPDARGPAECLAVPFAVLASLEGPGSGAASFERCKKGNVRCRWLDRGKPRELDCEPVPSDTHSAVLPPVGTLQPVDPALLAALHACGQTASRDSGGRLALARLQLRGQDGAIAGTDGRQLLLWGGFTFPFQDNLLVPAVSIFGSRELRGEQEVRIGRMEQQVAIAAGPWTIGLSIDADSRYPDVRAVLPRTSRLAKLVLDDADAAALLHDLQNAPEGGDENASVLLELGSRPMLRWPEGAAGRRGPLSLIRSRCSGPPMVIQLALRLLARALALGLREVRCAFPESPILFRDEHRCFLIAPFGPAAAPEPTSVSPDRQTTSAPGPDPSTSQPGGMPLSPDKTAGTATGQPADDAVLDPLTEAESLRVALMEVVRKTGQLIQSLRHFQKQRRALQAAMTSLKHLRLGPREEP